MLFSSRGFLRSAPKSAVFFQGLEAALLASSAGSQDLRKTVIAVTAQFFCAVQRLPCLQAPLDNGTREERGGAGRRAGGCL